MDRWSAERNGKGFAIRDRESFDQMIDLGFYKKPDIPEFVIRAFITKARLRADLHEEIYAHLLHGFRVEEFDREVQSLTKPTLLIWGAEDRIADVSAAARWVELNPLIRLDIIPETGHPSLSDSGSTIRARLRRFLEAASVEN